MLDGIKNFIWEMNRDEFNKSNKNKFYIRCMNCGARTRNQSVITDAIALWNRRVNYES